MPQIPGMFNGGVPPNLVWDEDNPPMRNGCNGEVSNHHEQGCDGSCERTPLTELEVNLTNEHREWARVGMRTEQIPHDLFRIENQINAIIQVVGRMLGEGGEAELNEAYQEECLKQMRGIRLAYQEQVKRVKFGLLPKPGVLGPDGKPIK